MTAKEIFEKDFQSYRECVVDSDIYDWATSNIFDLTTYDGDLNKLFVQVIIAVCKVILNRHTFKFIKDEAMYIAYILVCQMLERNNWIDWGTSIRGAWFDENVKAKPIFEGYDGVETVPFTKDNLIALIEFIEENEPEVEETKE
jgi:hypothetical protein